MNAVVETGLSTGSCARLKAGDSQEFVTFPLVPPSDAGGTDRSQGARRRIPKLWGP